MEMFLKELSKLQSLKKLLPPMLVLLAHNSLKLNKEPMYKSATPMKLIKVSAAGYKNIFLLTAYNLLRTTHNFFSIFKTCFKNNNLICPS